MNIITNTNENRTHVLALHQQRSTTTTSITNLLHHVIRLIQTSSFPSSTDPAREHLHQPPRTITSTASLRSSRSVTSKRNDPRDDHRSTRINRLLSITAIIQRKLCATRGRQKKTTKRLSTLGGTTPQHAVTKNPMKTKSTTVDRGGGSRKSGGTVTRTLTLATSAERSVPTTTPSPRKNLKRRRTMTKTMNARWTSR